MRTAVSLPVVSFNRGSSAPTSKRGCHVFFLDHFCEPHFLPPTAQPRLGSTQPRRETERVCVWGEKDAGRRSRDPGEHPQTLSSAVSIHSIMHRILRLAATVATMRIAWLFTFFVHFMLSGHLSAWHECLCNGRFLSRFAQFSHSTCSTLETVGTVKMSDSFTSP